MKYRVVHRTRYTYSQPVVLAHSEARLQPRTTPAQACTSTAVTIAPEPQQRHEHDDAFGNRVLYFALQEPHQELAVTAVDVQACAGVVRGCMRASLWASTTGWL